MSLFRSRDMLKDLRRRTQVALFGYYNCGNFGDDLMGVMIAKFLTEAGYSVRIFGISDVDGDELSLDRAPDLDDLLHDADVLVVGGGGLLCKRVFTPASAAYQNQITTILDRCQQSKTPVMAVSIGGSGHAALANWQEPALRLILAATFCTFRNPEDLRIMRRCGRSDFNWYPDLVWLTSHFFPMSKIARDRPAIGVNMVRAPYGRRVVQWLPWLLDRQTGADVFYLDTTSVASKEFAGVASRDPFSKSVRYKFAGLTRDLEFLANLDLVITNRLHSAMAAMSYGAAMISFFGYGKTRLALRHVGKSANHVSYRNVVPFLSRLMSPAKWQPNYPGLSSQQIEVVQSRALNHLDELVQALDRVAATKGVGKGSLAH